jgi:hypothetical protein
MKAYVQAFFIVGVLIPIVLHFVGRGRMPWWPDTVSLAIAFGVVAVLLVSKTRKDREINRRLWNAAKGFFESVLH